jgi:RNA polymerase sigma factor (TIGR02999 family)
MLTQASTGALQRLLDRFRAGDERARETLLQHALDRFRHLARRLFPRSSSLRALYETDDVLQRALIRLHRALDGVKPPDVGAFYGLAARQMRWVFRDLSRQSEARQAVTYPGSQAEPEDRHSCADHLAAWSDFHNKIEQLPEEEREMFDLLFYEGLTQEEAAAVLSVSVRTVKRRWQRARLLLHQALHGVWPEVG